MQGTSIVFNVGSGSDKRATPGDPSRSTIWSQTMLRPARVSGSGLGRRAKGCGGMGRLEGGPEDCSAGMSQWSRSAARPRHAAWGNRAGMISARAAAWPQTTLVGEPSAAGLAAFTGAASLVAAFVKTTLSVQETTIRKEHADAEDIH